MNARILVVDDSPTIQKVVAAILKRNSFDAVLAGDGQEALDLLERERIDLVLLDFVMPRMNGYQFCRELRAHDELKNMPVVLMSAKGDKIRGQFVQQTGAIDAITKPFDARGLVAVIEGALKKHEEGRARPLVDAESMLDELVPERPSRVSFSEDPALRRIQAAEELGTALSRLVVPELVKVPELARFADEAVQAVQRAVTPEAMASLSTLVRSLHFGDRTHEVLAGDISVVSIAEVLQLLDLQRQTGALGVFTKHSEVTLYIREGKLDFSSSRGLRDEFLLGRYLIELGAVSREELFNVLEQRGGTSELIGQHLLELGIIDAEQLRRALVRQTSELIYEVVRWKHGRFSFTVGAENPAAQAAALGMETGALVMEGFRRVDEWRVIEGSFDFDEVLYRDTVALERLDEEANLTRQERAVLEAIDGQRTIREVVDLMNISSFELCKVLYQFLNSRLVRRRAT